MKIIQVIKNEHNLYTGLADDGEIYDAMNIIVGITKASNASTKLGWVKKEIMDPDIVAKYDKINKRLREIEKKMSLVKFQSKENMELLVEWKEALKVLPLIED